MADQTNNASGIVLNDEATSPPSGIVVPPELTSGWKTSEFWIHVVAQILAIVVALGLLTSDKADAVFKFAGAAITAIFSVLGAIFYAQNRTSLKRQL